MVYRKVGVGKEILYCGKMYIIPLARVGEIGLFDEVNLKFHPSCNPKSVGLDVYEPDILFEEVFLHKQENKLLQDSIHSQNGI